MPRSRTRNLARNSNPDRRIPDSDWPARRFAQLCRDVRKKMAKFRASPAFARILAEQAKAAAQQKAPGLSTGGSVGSGDEAED